METFRAGYGFRWLGIRDDLAGTRLAFVVLVIGRRVVVVTGDKVDV